MADDSHLSPHPAPYRVTDPERIPTPRYYDGEFYQLERERLWPHAWQMACRLEQIPNIGDWIEYSNLGKSVIVVRTKDGVKAFHNACRHRGVQLAKGRGSCDVQGFACPFHGWRWNIEGRNTFVYGKHLFSEKQLEQGDLDLVPCRVELWGGCAFINHDDDAPSFRNSMGPLAERLGRYGLDRMRAEWWYSTVLPANWKVAMEAFMEGYHVMRTHPQLQEANPGLFNRMYGQDTGGLGRVSDPRSGSREAVRQQFRQMELLSEGMGGMCHAKDVATARALLDIELPSDPMQAMADWYHQVKTEVVRQGRERGEATPDIVALGKSHPIKAVEFLFPHYFLLPYLSSFAAYRIRPLGPESCLFEIWSLTLFPEGKEPPSVTEPTMLPWDSTTFPQIPQQDYSNIPAQQIGLHAAGFDFMRLSKEVEGMIGNYHQIIDGYLNGVDLQKLSKAQHELGGNFDGPIKNLGL